MRERYKCIPQEDYMYKGRNCIFLIYLFIYVSIYFPWYFNNVEVLKEFLLGEDKFHDLKDFSHLALLWSWPPSQHLKFKDNKLSVFNNLSITSGSWSLTT